MTSGEPYTLRGVRTVREGAWPKPPAQAGMARMGLPHDFTTKEYFAKHLKAMKNMGVNKSFTLCDSMEQFNESAVETASTGA